MDKIKKFRVTDHHLKGVLYGTSGVGKTFFTRNTKDCLWVSAEGGLLSIADTNPDFWEVKSLRDLFDCYLYLASNKTPYKTVVVDSITEINEVCKSEIERKRSGGVMQIQDWGELLKKLRNIFRKFRDLDMNVLLIAQEQYVHDDTVIQKIVPSLNGKASTDIAYFMDVVGYATFDKEGKHYVQVSPHPKLLTKSRTPLIFDGMPNLQAWIDALEPTTSQKNQQIINKMKDGTKNN